jgi:Domain of unknown function (DUF1843)
MAKKSAPSGVMLVYGDAIGNAIARGNAGTEELIALRTHAKAILESQGDLASALTALDKEIGKRGDPAAPPAAATPSERFVVQIVGLAIPPAVKLKLEQVINETVKATFAKSDSGGSLVATPLSQIKSFGGSLGGATAGMIANFEKRIL